MHLVITDSGLGGLSICAALERTLRDAGAVGVALTYVNAWPFDDRGYNDLPDMATRATVFDRALTRMAALAPDNIVIACNTLSIVYGSTAFCRAPGVPVRGIVDAGVSLFHEALAADPASAIVLLGTKTTIDSGTHRDELVRRGIAPTRIAAVSCHGLAGAIERDPDGSPVAELLEICTNRACEAQPPGGTLLVGLCCTHYGYVADRITDALVTKCCRPVRILDPNLRLVDELLPDLARLPGVTGSVSEKSAHAPSRPAPPAKHGRNSHGSVSRIALLGARKALLGHAPRTSGLTTLTGLTPPAKMGTDQATSASPDIGLVTVNVLSKVAISESSRMGINRLIAPVSAATARALQSYAHVPDLF